MSRIACIPVIVFSLLVFSSVNHAAEIYRGTNRSTALQTVGAATKPEPNVQQNEQTEAEKKELEEQKKLEKEKKEREMRIQLEKTWEDRRRRFVFPYRQPTLNRFSNGRSTIGQGVFNQTPVRQYHFQPVPTYSRSHNQSRINQTSPMHRGYFRSHHNQSQHNISAYGQRRFVAFPIHPLYPY